MANGTCLRHASSACSLAHWHKIWNMQPFPKILSCFLLAGICKELRQARNMTGSCVERLCILRSTLTCKLALQEKHASACTKIGGSLASLLLLHSAKKVSVRVTDPVMSRYLLRSNCLKFYYIVLYVR